MVDRRVVSAFSTELSLLELLTVAQRRLARGLSTALAEEGCTVDQWRILRALADGEGHPMGALAESLTIPHATLTRLMEGLVDSGLVYRRQSSVDRRSVAVHLSRRGRERLARLDALAASHDVALRDSEKWAALRTALLARL